MLSVPSPSAYFLPPREARQLADRVNEELAGISREHPDRFSALGLVVMQDTDLALATTAHAVDQLGMAGVMLLTNVNGIPLDDARFEPVWEAAAARRLLVYVHPTVPEAGDSLADHALAISVGFFADTNLAIARLAYSGVFERYPGIRWVFSHMGGTLPSMLPCLDSYWCQFPEARARCRRLPSDYVRRLLFDTAITHRPAIRCACETLPKDRFLFGTDYPACARWPGLYLDALEAMQVEGAERAELVGGRARRLLDGETI